MRTTRVMTLDRSLEFAALLDSHPPRGCLPPLWHWFDFSEITKSAELGPDGHPLYGDLLPPIPRRRRLWGGGRFSFFAPVRAGDELTRHSEITSIQVKKGSTSEFLLVTERHRYVHQGSDVALDEIDIIYRTAEHRSQDSEVEIEVREADRALVVKSDDLLTFTADPLMLFGFSAITRNFHRIHYDAAYAKGVEGHRGLVVHGPLLALMGLELSRRRYPDVAPKQFDVRIRRPVFAGDEIVYRKAGEERQGTIRATVEGRGRVLEGEVLF